MVKMCLCAMVGMGCVLMCLYRRRMCQRKENSQKKSSVTRETYTQKTHNYLTHDKFESLQRVVGSLGCAIARQRPSWVHTMEDEVHHDWLGEIRLNA